MQNKTKKYSGLKYYHIIFLSILLCPLLILNSNSVNKKREEEKLFKRETEKIKNIFLRKLDFTSDTNEICKKGNEDLQQYYETGDGNIIGINDEKIESKNNPEYIQSLINLISGSENNEDDSGILDYIKHIIPALIFLVIAILSLPGWLVCCICSCANCCCCCCCKKAFCKLPFYIISCVIYAFVVAVSIYGLSQSNSIFVGLADTECSLLKFIGEVLDGETRQTKPRWGGISGIQKLLLDTKKKIGNLGDSTKTDLSNNKNQAENKKQQFEDALDKYSHNIDTDDGSYHYKQNLSPSEGNGIYSLDIIYKFGVFDKNNPQSANEGTFVKSWYEEYKEVAKNSKEQMDEAYRNFDTLIGKKDEASNALDSGVNSIDDIKQSFDDVKDQISSIIVDNSDTIDKFGKLIFKIVFSLLMAINLGIAAFITLLFFCKFPVCQNGCLKCLLKSLIHILWNILALLTFLTLLIGSIFTLLGTVGKDLILVVEYLVSDENLGKPEPALLGEAGEYLKICINGNGDLKEKLNLNLDSMNNLEDLRAAKRRIDEAKQNAQNLLDTKIAYNAYKTEYEARKSYSTDDFKLINIENTNIYLTFRDYLSKLNNNIPNGKQDTWSISCTPNKHSCDTLRGSETSQYCIEPSSCSDKGITDWYPTSNLYANVIDHFIKSIKTASETDVASNTKSIKSILDILDTKYTGFLEGQTSSLDIFNRTITDLTDIFNEFAGEDGEAFSFVNCKFIGRNVKVILKNLEKSLGTNIYTVGIILIVAGLALCISISFTILLNILINIKDKEIGNDGIQVINFNN